MIRLIMYFVWMFCSGLIAQNTLETDLQKALIMWEENKTSEAVKLLESIGVSEHQGWLTSYYLGIIHVTEAFKNSQNKLLMENHLKNAEKASDLAFKLAPNEVEVMVLKAMVLTAWVVYDPMVNGQSLSPEIIAWYGKAEKLEPNNPRVYFKRAQFELGSAKFLGMSTKPMCEQIQKSIQLFDNFKPKSNIHPNWGKLEALEFIAANCK
ncbi:MAG: hypothetical protein ACK4JX_02360 [Flavobacterium sp.]